MEDNYSGKYYAMNRDRNLHLINMTYDAIINGENKIKVCPTGKFFEV